MTPEQFNQKFIESIEIQRVAKGYTQKEMADFLEMSISSYKKMVSGDTSRINLYMSYKMYIFCRMLTYELAGYSDHYVDVISKMKHLRSDEVYVIESLIDFFLARREE